MSTTPLQIRDLSDSIAQIPNSEFVDLSSTISAPNNAAIVNRARIPDLANDLAVRFGVERKLFQGIYLIPTESGPNGEPVYGVLNDDAGLVRVVGAWGINNDTSGQRISSVTVNDFIEITFYGTGLNVFIATNTGMNFTAKVDSGSESANLYPTLSSVLNGRSTTPNVVVAAATGLSLGIHTVIIKNASVSGTTLSGFEVINNPVTAKQLKINPGTYLSKGRRLKLAAQASPTYDASVDAFESGTLGTRGGRVSVYLKEDGTIGKAVQPVDTTPKAFSFSGTNSNGTWTGAAADHTNEEIIRSYHYREFGAGRNTANAGQVADDFSSDASGSISRAFTLDDGTTTLALFGTPSGAVGASAYSGAGIDGNGAFLTITFVGTGLDIVRGNLAGTNGTNTVTIDNGASGTLGTSVVSGGLNKIVSGLPYGTHVVRIATTAAGPAYLSIKNIIIYGPKKPAIPTGAIELADYNILADFVKNSTLSNDAIATGVLRKATTREAVYTGTGWAQSINIGASTAGFFGDTSVSGDTISYTFFGTGFDFRFITNTDRTTNATATLDGSAFIFANFGAIATAAQTNAYGFTYNATTGVMVMNVANGTGGLVVSGLSLGVHTIKITNNAAARLSPQSLDIITPVYSHKSNLYADLQNTLTVGSCSLSDNRKLATTNPTETKAWSQATGVASGPTNSSTTPVPIPDMSCNIKTGDGALKISYSVSVYTTVAGDTAQILAYVDGVAVTTTKRMRNSTANYSFTISDIITVPVSAGFHKVDLYWHLVAAGTMGGDATFRTLLVEEK